MNGKIKPWIAEQTYRLDNLLGKWPFTWTAQPGVIGPVIALAVRNAAIASIIFGWLYGNKWLYVGGLSVIALSAFIGAICIAICKIAESDIRNMIDIIKVGIRELISFKSGFLKILIIDSVTAPFVLLIMVLTLILKGINKAMKAFSRNDNARSF